MLSLIAEFLWMWARVFGWMCILYYGLSGTQYILFYFPAPWLYEKKTVAPQQVQVVTRQPAQQRMGSARIQPRKQYTLQLMFSEIYWSACTQLVGSMLVSIVVLAYQHDKTYLYWHWREYGVVYYFFSLFGAILFNDSWMYWTHRWLHTRWGFANIHKIHHRFSFPTPFSTMAFHPGEALTQFFPVLGAIFMPLHLPSFLVMSLTFLFISVTEHLGYRIPLYEWICRTLHLSSSVHHDLHHYVYKCNYAVYFTLWDSLMGTMVDDHTDKSTMQHLKQIQLGPSKKQQ